MDTEKWQMCIHRSETTRAASYTIAGIEAQRIEGGRIYGGGGNISELHRKDNDMKKCTKCGIEKELSEFGKENRTKSGHTSQCKECLYLPKKLHTLKLRQTNTCAICKKILVDIRSDARYCLACYKFNKRINLKIIAFRYKDIRAVCSRKYEKSQRDLIGQYYIKKLLKKDGFNKNTIESNPELIEIKRLIIKTKRL